MAAMELLGTLVDVVSRRRVAPRPGCAQVTADDGGSCAAAPPAAVHLPAPRRAPAQEPAHARVERPDLRARYGRMAQVAPAETVRRSFDDVEQLLRSVVAGGSQCDQGDPAALARRARETGVIDDVTLQTLDGLVRRHEAACARPMSVHATHADAFLDAAATAEVRLRRAGAASGAGPALLRASA